jgi:hypothetical protein
MRCIHPVALRRGSADIEKSRNLEKGLVLKGSKAGTWKVTILDRLDFDPARRALFSDAI